MAKQRKRRIKPTGRTSTVSDFVSRFEKSKFWLTRVKHRQLWFWLIPGLLVLTFLYFYIFKDFPSPGMLTSDDLAQTTKIYDRNGKLLYDIFVDKNRSFIPLDQIPQVMREATIAIEDKDFYKHGGVDIFGGIIRALKEIIFKQQLQGGSTITQQLVKTALLTPERTIQRKIKEVLLSLIVELRYDKDKILELYLNNVPYGGTAWGIEAAAERYFGKKAADLNLAEAALLAGLPQAPTLYSPTGAHPEYAKARQKAVLNRMVEDGKISQQEADAAYAAKLNIMPPATDIKAPHFVMYVKQKLVEKYGEKLVEQGGLKVTTTLDLDLQEKSQQIVASEVAKLKDLRVSNGAALVTRPFTGEILAMVGSTDYFASQSGNFNVTTALRQPGSAIKPINYAIGLETRKITPASVFNDIPTCFVAIPKNYCPVNYDGKFHGPVQMRFALGNSYNIPAVKMLKLNTVETMLASASAFGLNSFKDPANYGLSLTLGGGEVTMTEMATAFGVFANGGIRKDLQAILKVEDKNGRVLEEYKDPNLGAETPSQLLLDGPRVISAETAFLISHILLDQNARSAAFGISSLNIPGHPNVSVKTGTTDEKRDNWTIGFTPEILVAAWVGNNDNSAMHPFLTSGITGAAPIWNQIMQVALEGKKESFPKQPVGIVGASVCSISGKLPPDDGSCIPRFEYFIRGTVPTEKENLKQSVLIDTTTNMLARPDQAENVATQERLIITDVVGSIYCLDCNATPAAQVIN